MKGSRQEAILQIIARQDIQKQEELLESLRQEGYEVTQATISRDIRKLKLTKVPTPTGGFKYVCVDSEKEEEDNKYIRVLKESFISMEVAQNILVIKSISGMAMALAAAIDTFAWKEIVGCIAGDDTIMCVLHNEEEARYIYGQLEVQLGNR